MRPHQSRGLAFVLTAFAAISASNVAHAQYAAVPRSADPAPTAAEEGPDGSASPPPRGHFAMKGMFGGTLRRLYSIPFRGLDVQASFGAEWAHWAIYGTIGLLFGRTENGLQTNGAELGVSTELRQGSFALGVGAHSSYLGFVRATDETTLGALGFGLAPFVTCDLYRGDDDHALFLSAKMNLDSFGGAPTAFVWGPTLSLGARY